MRYAKFRAAETQAGLHRCHELRIIIRFALEEAGVLDCFVEVGAELQHTQVAPEADAFTFSEIAGHTGVSMESESYASATVETLLERLREVTSDMDEKQVTTGLHYLFITPTLKGMLDDFSYANPNRSNRVLERFSRIVEVPQVRFYTAIDLLSGGDDNFGYRTHVDKASERIPYVIIPRDCDRCYELHCCLAHYRRYLRWRSAPLLSWFTLWARQFCRRSPRLEMTRDEVGDRISCHPCGGRRQIVPVRPFRVHDLRIGAEPVLEAC